MRNTLQPGDVVLVLNKDVQILNKEINIFKIRRRDILIFKKQTNNEESLYYVKRCIGKKNDQIQTINGDIYVNNKKEYISEKTIINKKNNYASIFDSSIYRIKTKNDLNKNINMNDFTCSNFWIPAIDSSVPSEKMFSAEHLLLIKTYEDTCSNENCYGSYKFQNNYYYMIGDNRMSSTDSRNWGCIPEKNFLGKAIIVLFSIEYSYEGKHKLRSNRILKVLN